MLCSYNLQDGSIACMYALTVHFQKFLNQFTQTTTAFIASSSQSNNSGRVRQCTTLCSRGVDHIPAVFVAGCLSCYACICDASPASTTRADIAPPHTGAVS